MKVSFSYGLLNKSNTDSQSVYIRVKHNTLQFKRTLNLPIQKEWWDFKIKRLIKEPPAFMVHESKQVFDFTSDMINVYEREFYNDWATLKYQVTNINNEFSSKDWRNWCEEIIQRIQKPVELTIKDKPKLHDLWSDFIKENEGSESLRKSTLKGYRDKLSMYRQFENYSITERNPNPIDKKYIKTKKSYRTDELDMNFYISMKEYFLHKKKVKLKRDLTEIERAKVLNTFGDVVKKIKTICKEAWTDGVQVNKKVFDKKFKAISERLEHDILTPDELNKLWSIGQTEEEENLVKLTKILYYGCLRISDLQLNFEKGFNGMQKNLEWGRDMYKKDTLYWTVTQQKSRAVDKTKRVPILSDEVSTYLTSKKEFPTIIKARFNQKVQKLVERAGIVKEVTSHTFRRSILTSMYEAKYPTSELMMFSGHKREQTLYSYINKKNLNWKTSASIDKDGNFIGIEEKLKDKN